jgi:hypothetical protein
MAQADRRCSFRYSPTRDLACLGWWEGGQFRTARVQLRNISTGGALVSLGQERQGSGKVWVCLVGQDVSQWVRAEVIGVTADDTRNYLVRLKFPEGCPYEVFQSAVWGQPIAAENIADPEPSAGFVSERLSTPPVKSRGAWSAKTHTRSTGTINPTWERPSHPQQASRQSPVPNQSEIDERSRSRSSLPWIMAFVINLFLVFWLGVLAAQRFQNIRAFWTHLGLYPMFGVARRNPLRCKGRIFD